VVRRPDEWSEENDEVPEVLRYAVRMEKGVCRYGQSLLSLVNFSLKVDDVLIMAKKAHYQKWARYVLWHIYSQAELFTNMNKNDLYGTSVVEYNGFLLDVPGEDGQKRLSKED